MRTEEQEEDVGEQDDQVGEDDEEEEEDKGDGSTHATFVADLTETAKPQLQENEKPSRRTKPDKPGKDEGEDEGERGGDDPDEKKKRRTPNTYLPQANQRSIGAPSK
jgi:hypothetical protein